jgi:hypothetical protein
MLKIIAAALLALLAACAEPRYFGFDPYPGDYSADPSCPTYALPKCDAAGGG